MLKKKKELENIKAYFSKMTYYERTWSLQHRDKIQEQRNISNQWEQNHRNAIIILKKWQAVRNKGISEKDRIENSECKIGAVKSEEMRKINKLQFLMDCDT